MTCCLLPPTLKQGHRDPFWTYFWSVAASSSSVVVYVCVCVCTSCTRIGKKRVESARRGVGACALAW